MNLLDQLKYRLSTGHSAVYRLLLINIAVFVFSAFIKLIAFLWQSDSFVLLKYFYLPANLGTFIIRPWSLITYMFFHNGFWHLLSNMLWLYFIGSILNDFLPNYRIYRVFVGGGLFGGLLYVLSFNLFPVFAASVNGSVLLGASGGVLAVVVATATLVPHYTIRPFNLFNIEMRWIALISIVLDLVSIPNGNSGGHIAHLGGAFYGFLFIRYIQGAVRLPQIRWPSWLQRTQPDERQFKNSRKPSKVKNDPNKPRQEEVDAILDKISQSGYDSLSADEKEILFRASE